MGRLWWSPARQTVLERALARRFAEEGARKIIIADLDEQGLKRVETETGAEPFK